METGPRKREEELSAQLCFLQDAFPAAFKIGATPGGGENSPLFASFAPGRINLIGEHVDYMGGNVLPGAVNVGVLSTVHLPLTISAEANNDPSEKMILPKTLKFRSSLQGCSDLALNISLLIPVAFTIYDSCVVKMNNQPAAATVKELLTKAKILDENPSLASGWGLYVLGVVMEGLVNDVVPSFLKNGGEPAVSAEVASTEHTSEALSVEVSVESTVPGGAGMSSSAALCVSLIHTVRKLFSLRFEIKETPTALSLPDNLDSAESIRRVARRARMVENRYKGVNIGIMDQMASLGGTRGHLMHLNCDSLNYESVDASLLSDGEADVSLVLINSMVQHALGDQYNRIRAAMEEGQQKVRKTLNSETVTLVELGKNSDGAATEDILEKAGKRGRYVVEETKRTGRVIQILNNAAKNLSSMSEWDKRAAVAEVGRLMNETHRGLSDQLGVSTVELDFIQSFLTAEGGLFLDQSSKSREQDLPSVCYGARLMGGGFGGCVIALVRTSVWKEKVLPALEMAFLEKSGKQTNGLGPSIYPVELHRGAFQQTISPNNGQ